MSLVMFITDPIFYYLTASFIVGWSLWRALLGSRHFDFYTIFYLFALFFFGVAPIAQISMGLNLAPMYDETLTIVDYHRTNLVVLLIFAGFEVLYRMTWSRIGKDHGDETQRLETRSTFVWLPLVLLAVTVFLWYENFNLGNLLIRGGDEDVDRKAVSKLLALVCGMALRYVPMSAALFYWLYGARNKFILVVLLAVAVLCCFPTGMTRLQIVPVYLPLLMICIKWIRDKKMWLVSGLVGGILFVFPFMHGFREKEVDFSEFQFMDFSFLNSLHFDSFASFAFVLKQDMITYGEQLLGSLLFWFPRSLWPDKPIESGRMLAETFDLGMADFTNIAVNWFAEGYLNFGWLGVVLWSVVLAVICGWWDARFWSEGRNFDRKEAVYYFSGLGFLFFFLRGDMMNGTAYFTGLFVAHKLVELVMLQRIEK